MIHINEKDESLMLVVTSQENWKKSFLNLENKQKVNVYNERTYCPIIFELKVHKYIIAYTLNFFKSS